MANNFPANPVVGQTYETDTYTYAFDGVKWTSVRRAINNVFDNVSQMQSRTNLKIGDWCKVLEPLSEYVIGEDGEVELDNGLTARLSHRVDYALLKSLGYTFKGFFGTRFTLTGPADVGITDDDRIFRYIGNPLFFPVEVTPLANPDFSSNLYEEVQLNTGVLETGYQFESVNEAINNRDVSKLLGRLVYIKDRRAHFEVVLTASAGLAVNGMDLIQSAFNNAYSFKLSTDGKSVHLITLGADPSGAVDATDIINRAHEMGLVVRDEIAGTYKVSGVARFKSSFIGTASTDSDITTTKFVKDGAGALLVHYPQFKVYKNYHCDANYTATAFDVYRPSSEYAFEGGLKYSLVQNIRCSNQTERAFNLNGPLFGATLINCRVRANQPHEDNTIAFYVVIEDAEGIGTPTNSTNAAFSLVSPNVYNSQDRANNVTFLDAKYARGVHVSGAEVASARICVLTQADIYLQGAFEYINTHSTVFNSNLEVGGGSNIQVFRKGIEDWTGDTNIPEAGSHGRHIFRLADGGSFKAENISLFNNLGRDSGTTGQFGLCAVASGYTGEAYTKGISYTDLTSGGGFSQPFQYFQRDGSLSALCTSGTRDYEVVFTRDLLPTDGIRQLSSNGQVQYRVTKDTIIKESGITISGDTTAVDIEVRVRTLDENGVEVGAANAVVTIPAGSDDSFYDIGLDPNRIIPARGYCIVDVNPAGGTVNTNTTIYAKFRFNS